MCIFRAYGHLEKTLIRISRRIYNKGETMLIRELFNHYFPSRTVLDTIFYSDNVGKYVSTEFIHYLYSNEIEVIRT